MGQSCSLTPTHDVVSNTSSAAASACAHDHSSAANRPPQRTQPCLAVQEGVNVHAVLHDWAVRDETRLRAQQQLVADRLERSRLQHIVPPCSSATGSPKPKQLHSLLEISGMTLTATTPRETSSLSRTGKLSSAASTPACNPLMPPLVMES
jgi:hypothetical protein